MFFLYNDCSMTYEEKELERRKNILEGNEWRVIFSISMPIVIYNSLSQLFQFVDTLIAATMGPTVVSIVSFISQISVMLAAIGSGLGVGGGIIIARHFGAGNMEMVRKRISSILFLTFSIAALMLVALIPFAKQFLKLLNMPQELFDGGTKYFIIEITGLIFLFINTIYFSIEKSRGSTKTYMWCNILFIALKTSLNFLFVFILKGGMLMLPLATLISNGVITIIALLTLTSKKNPFKISLKSCSFDKPFLKTLTGLSLPIFLEKFIFAFGKVIVNSMCAFYGSSVIGALGVSNRLGGLSTQPPGGFQEGETALISQNLGNKNLRRALSIFYKVFLINLVFSLICFIITGIFQDPLVTLFAKDDVAFAASIAKIYYYERLDTILIAVNTSVMGLLYGFGKTKIALYINMVRLFIYRIPTLYFFIHFTNLGIEAVGIAMLVSNGLVGITSGAIAIPLIIKIKKQHALYEKTGDSI